MVAWDGKFGDGDKFVMINYFFIYNKNKLFLFYNFITYFWKTKIRFYYLKL